MTLLPQTMTLILINLIKNQDIKIYKTILKILTQAKQLPNK